MDLGVFTNGNTHKIVKKSQKKIIKKIPVKVKNVSKKIKKPSRSYTIPSNNVIFSQSVKEKYTHFPILLEGMAKNIAKVNCVKLIRHKEIDFEVAQFQKIGYCTKKKRDVELDECMFECQSNVNYKSMIWYYK